MGSLRGSSEIVLWHYEKILGKFYRIIASCTYRYITSTAMMKTAQKLFRQTAYFILYGLVNQVDLIDLLIAINPGYW